MTVTLILYPLSMEIRSVWLLENVTMLENFEERPFVTVKIFLAYITTLFHYGNFKTVIAPASILETFRKARERAGKWWVVFAVAMIVLAISFFVLAIGLYVFLKGR